MKNFINYYYGLNISNIYFDNGKYYFYNDTVKYILRVCDNDIFLRYYNDLYQQISKYQYFFKIIPNIDNKYITWIENKPYILLETNILEDYKISIFDIKTDYYVSLSNDLLSLNRFNWENLWENKIDYFEEWFSTKQDSYKKVFSLFHYFIGIAENALLYLKETKREEVSEEVDRLVVSHNRITLDYNLYDYYDPTNIIIDHSSRDVSEYIKSMFVNKVWDLELIKEYLSNHKFSRYGLRVMFSRILFPSFFFDYIEEMIANDRDIDLLFLEARTSEFQEFIKQISIFFLEEYNIPVIQWIIK